MVFYLRLKLSGNDFKAKSEMVPFTLGCKNTGIIDKKSIICQSNWIFQNISNSFILAINKNNLLLLCQISGNVLISL